MLCCRRRPLQTRSDRRSIGPVAKATGAARKSARSSPSYWQPLSPHRQAAGSIIPRAFEAHPRDNFPMKRPRPPRRSELPCGAPGPDDGIDPRKFFKSQSNCQPHRKTQQLCGQIRRTLDYLLSGDCDDPVLRELIVVDVRPAPDASRLLVTVAPLDSRSTLDPRDILGRLHAVASRLRHEVSQSIHRRKTPQLTFAVSGPAELSTPDAPHADLSHADLPQADATQGDDAPSTGELFGTGDLSAAGDAPPESQR